MLEEEFLKCLLDKRFVTLYNLIRKFNRELHCQLIPLSHNFSLGGVTLIGRVANARVVGSLVALGVNTLIHLRIAITICRALVRGLKDLINQLIRTISFLGISLLHV